MLLSEITPEEHTSAFLGLSVISNGPKPALTFVPKCLELRYEIACAGSEGFERRRDDDAALLIALNEVCPFEI